MNLFNTNTTKYYSKSTRVNNEHGGQKKQAKWEIRKNNQDEIIKAIEDRIITDVKNLFEQEEVYYKPVTVGNFYSNKYIEYKSDGDRNKTINQKILHEIKPYLKAIINFKKSKDSDEDHVMH